uniref:Ferritin n=1 Tax=Nothobranchius furzeri TaxID=105023 RepID=A0A8C6NJC1_NOTFU
MRYMFKKSSFLQARTRWCTSFHRLLLTWNRSTSVLVRVTKTPCSSGLLPQQAHYFSRDDVTLPGFAHFFKENSDEEREHAEKLLAFQNKRGGRIFLQDVRKPERNEWGSGLEAMQCALQLEKNVNQALLDLHKLASDRQDPLLCDFLESHYLNEQVEAIKKLGDHITNLTKMDASTNKMAEYLFDEHTLGGKK